MSKIEKFEDILAWQKGRIIINDIYDITGTGNFKSDWTLKDQILRAAISINLNIAEGFGRQTKKEFKQFLFYAHGSVAELQSALYIALDRKYITKELFNNVYSKSTEVSKILSGLIKYLKT